MAFGAAAQNGTQSPNDGQARAVRAELHFEIDSNVADVAVKQRERETAEDMAVMGRLVEQTLAALYTPTGGCAECHDGTTAWWGKRADSSAWFRRAILDSTGLPPTQQQRRAFDLFLSRGQSSRAGHSAALSTYLEGYGVVCQLEAPAPAADDEEPEQAQAKCPFLTHTPWQRTQLELRGQWKNDQCIDCHSTASGDKSAGEANVIDQLVRRKLAMRYLYQGDWHTQDMTLLGIEPHHRSAWPPTRAKLVATLLDLLAENGHNFRHLAPEERVAVALTLRAGGEPSYALRRVWQWMFAPELPDASPDEPQDNEVNPEDARGGAEASPDKDSGASVGDLIPHNPGGATNFGDFDADGDLDVQFTGPEGRRLFRNLGNGQFQSDGVSAFDVSAFDYDNNGRLDLYVTQGQPTTQELTGDLQMRQRNYAAAIASYEKAIQNAMQSAPDGGRAAHRPLYNKLIQALVAANRFDEAKKFIDLLGGIEKPAPPQNRSREASHVAATRFPARLVVSATMAQLDAVHSGEMSREEFAKQATVRYVDPNVKGDQGENE